MAELLESVVVVHLGLFVGGRGENLSTAAKGDAIQLPARSVEAGDQDIKTRLRRR
ncbi:hypothetical protein OG978_43570 (plasmid) [Streptomyces sp. NBC_01591]|uniref:hypothetical protein n=1 Tax=Streptomyces sp. NBC_01591 TaxID=2975888 RepID=UPI002DDA20E7|nr:hypothetical protein [Streptomyces sp. NBC_01591]WSD74042.1 hypothetical protein OG978_43570 [Streptomyces sp. NBC_01591]